MENERLSRSEMITRMIIGDLDKSFHLPECECDACENWRKNQGRRTYGEMKRGMNDE